MSFDSVPQNAPIDEHSGGIYVFTDESVKRCSAPYTTPLTYKGVVFKPVIVHRTDGTVTGYIDTGSKYIKIDLTELDKLATICIDDRDNHDDHDSHGDKDKDTDREEHDESDSDLDDETEPYNTKYDEDNYQRFYSQLSDHRATTYSDFLAERSMIVRSFLQKSAKTQLMDVYSKAVRTISIWIDNLEKHKEDTESDLAKVLRPYQKIIGQLNKDFDFGLLRSLDDFFFGIKDATYWHHSYGSPKIGSIVTSDNKKWSQYVMEHGIATMRLEFLGTDFFSYVRIEKLKKDFKLHQKMREHEMKQYVRMITQILDEYNY